MRFDNSRAQHDWNRRASRAKNSRIAVAWAGYGLAALAVSALWLIELAFAGSPGMYEDGPSRYILRLRDWSSIGIEMSIGGVIVAFLFRKHMRNAKWWVAGMTAPCIGLLASCIAAIPFLVSAGPMVFTHFWVVTVPMSCFSFWFMRMADTRFFGRSNA